MTKPKGVDKMKVYRGKSVYHGVAIGPLCLYQPPEPPVKRVHIEDVSAETARFLKARERTMERLAELYAIACREVGETHASIFEIHRMMLEDGDYQESVCHVIETQKVNAEYAVAATARNFSQIFASMEDAYMQARAADVKDASERLLATLTGKEQDGVILKEPVILAAEDLSPSQTVQLDKSKVLAFVTRKGSVNSHTAILARTMNIPAIIGADLPMEEENRGKMAIVDGETGTIYLDPDPPILARMEKKRQEEEEQRRLLQTLKGKDTVTKDGKAIRLYANIGSHRDLAQVLQNDADGIGLFRSEFLYLERETYPREEEQLAVYRSVLETMGGRQTIIRTLDIGADKRVSYFGLGEEENPALGLRAIRLCLTRPDLFKTQLRALFRGAVYGNLSIMYPMITSMKEVRQIQACVEEVKRELEEEGLPFQVPEQGVMIETPAAVMIADQLAEEFSFFSIGTNDLSQYTLAMDRQNAELDPFFDPKSDAVLKMISMVAKAGKKAGIWVGICGELGADTTLTETFLRMGVEELSVAPSRVLAVRKVIRETDLSQ